MGKESVRYKEGVEKVRLSLTRSAFAPFAKGYPNFGKSVPKMVPSSIKTFRII